MRLFCKSGNREFLCLHSNIRRFVECLWIHLGANIPAASAWQIYMYSQSVPFLSLAIFTADRQQSVFIHCLHQHDVCPLHLWTLCSTELTQMYLIRNSKFVSTVTFVRERRITCSFFWHTLYVGLPSMMQIQFMKPALRKLQYEHNRHTISYMFQYCLSAIIRGSALLQVHHQCGPFLMVALKKCRNM